MNPLTPPKPDGLSHDTDGCTDPAMSPPYTLISATTANSTSTASSVTSSTICVRALSSMPTTQIHVMPMMNATPSASVAQLLSPAWFHPKSWNVYTAAIPARFGMMTRSATALLQPPIHRCAARSPGSPS